MSESLERQAGYLENRLRKRDRHLRKWARRESVECYRLYDRDIPEVPLVVDRYALYAHVSLFERPYPKPKAEELAWLDRMCEVVSGTLDLPSRNIFRKFRRRQPGTDQYDRVSREGLEITVREGGLEFWVNLSDYLDTGLFLDHRTTRTLVRDEARGRRTLNLFCYTGTFSAYAASGGASTVDSVDLSNTYLAWARRNMERNGFSGPPYSFLRRDVLEFLAAARGRRKLYDLIVLDPPTFSNSKRMSRPLDTARDWPFLVESCLEILAPSGILWFSTNSRSFRIDESRLSGTDVRDMTAATTPPDFEGSRPHRCWRITRR